MSEYPVTTIERHHEPLELRTERYDAPLSEGERELVERLAYEACQFPHVPFLRRVEALGIERSEYVRLTNHPEFREELRRQTFAHLYLPNHYDQKVRELRDAARGRGNSREQVFGKYLEEGVQAGGHSLEITRTETIRVQAMERLAEKFGSYLTGDGE